MSVASRLHQTLLVLCGLARVSSLGILPQPESEALTGTGVNEGMIEVAPWALRPGEHPTDFVHTLDGAMPYLPTDVGENLSRIIPARLDKKQHSPKTAILLVGMMRDWERHIGAMLSGMVHPNNADIFIHTSRPVDNALVERLGSNLKRHVHREATNSLGRGWNPQFFNFEEAFKLMSDYEQANGFTYDVVVRARSDVVPKPPAWLNLEEWRDEGRIHMMTDMIFWGRRDDMAKIAKTHSGVQRYYKKYPDPWKRPIAVASLLDTLLRDPFVNRHGGRESWLLYQKIQTLPYPNMKQEGAIKNLKKAMEHGLEFVRFEGNDTCAVSHGDVFNVNDYRFGRLVCEKDLLHWVLVHNLTICDIGSSMNLITFKGNTIKRRLASDCSIKISLDQDED